MFRLLNPPFMRSVIWPVDLVLLAPISKVPPPFRILSAGNKYITVHVTSICEFLVVIIHSCAIRCFPPFKLIVISVVVYFILTSFRFGQLSLHFRRCSFIFHRLNIYLASLCTFSFFGVSPIRFVLVLPLPVFHFVHFLRILLLFSY